MSKLKKYIATTILVILCVFCLSSCGIENKNYEEYKPTQGSIFICIESYTDPYLGDVKILVDKETKIMYMYYWKNSNNDYGVSGITVLYESDGKPKKYSGVITD